MTRTYVYPDFVDREKILIIDGNIQDFPYRWRTELIIPFKSDSYGGKKKNSIAFIMKNPSIADKQVCDKTISNVLYYVNRIREVDAQFEKINEVKVLNLFSIYSTDVRNLFDIIEEVGSIEQLKENNNKAIKRLLNDTDFIIPAWGGLPNNVSDRSNSYRDRVIEVMNILRNFESEHQIFLIKYNKPTLYPHHPERIGYKGEKIYKYYLNRYKIQNNLFVPL